jgi:hypothetical protein
LWSGNLDHLAPDELDLKAPVFAFKQRDHTVEESYLKGFPVADLFPINSVGIVTARDSLTIDIEKAALWNRIEDFARSDPEALRSRYSLGEDVQDWSVAAAKADVIANFNPARMIQIAYRPLDKRWTFYTGSPPTPPQHPPPSLRLPAYVRRGDAGLSQCHLNLPGALFQHGRQGLNAAFQELVGGADYARCQRFFF